MAKVLDHLKKFRLELGPHGDPARVRGWALERDADGIAWLALDLPDSGVNTLGTGTLQALGDLLGGLESDPPVALVIRSAKPGGFIAGADIREFRAGEVEAEKAGERNAEIIAALKAGHAVLDRLEILACPTIAVVHGHALGGGFELALAADYRIAVPGTSFGFPEVRLGLHPGLGGTFRLPALIDPVEAMTMMLTGKSAHTKKAENLGIVDAVVEERHVAAAVRDFAGRERASRATGLKGRALDLDMVRGIAANRMRAETRQRVSEEHYPAPFALIDLWEEFGDDRDAMQSREIVSFAKMLKTPTARNLIRIFLLREHLKGSAQTGRRKRSARPKSKGDGIGHVHVIGAGAMGAEIAAWCAIEGFRVTLFDIAAEPLAQAVKTAGAIAGDAHLDRLETRDALDRLIPDPKGFGAAAADLVIEAAPEKTELKRKIYSSLAGTLRKDAILATNTSSLSIEDLARHAPDPARFAGLHFFNPVSRLEFVELVGHAGSDTTVLAQLAAFAVAISKLPARVSDYPGFVVNRALTPYMLEAMLMMSEGIPKEHIDRAAEAFGMPVGPVELADRVGLDICLDVAESLGGRLERPFPEIPQRLADMIERGEIGRKAGKGFYHWSGDEPAKNDASDEDAFDDRTIQDRLILPMLDACVEIKRRQIVDGDDTIDAALVYGAGFAPFRGGPMRYAESRGHEVIVETMRRLAEEHGERFTPDPGWDRAPVAAG